MNSDINQNHLDRINQLLKTYPSLMDAYHKLEPFVLSLFDADRMSIFQRRRQHQDLVARFKTGKETREIKVPISPMSIAGYVALSQLPLIINDPYNKEILFLCIKISICVIFFLFLFYRLFLKKRSIKAPESSAKTPP